MTNILHNSSEKLKPELKIVYLGLDLETEYDRPAAVRVALDDALGELDIDKSQLVFSGFDARESSPEDFSELHAALIEGVNAPAGEGEAEDPISYADEAWVGEGVPAIAAYDTDTLEQISPMLYRTKGDPADSIVAVFYLENLEQTT